MPPVDVAQVARVCEGTSLGDETRTADRFAADSRTLTPGQGFVALGRGHDHVAEALERGASFAVVSDRGALPPGASGVVVDSTPDALWALARMVRERLDVRVVGITGSMGKTLTKDLVRTAVGSRFRVHASPGSYNNEEGVPLTVLSCPDDAEVLVCEMGARHPGDIAALCDLTHPEVGVVTGIGLTHLGIFGDRDTIAHSKAELLASLPASGHGIVPSTDDYLDVLCADTAARVTTVGPGGHVRVVDAELDAHGRAKGTVEIDGRAVPVHLRLPGRHFMRNAALAVTTAWVLGADPEDAAARLSDADLSAWRMEMLRVGGRTIVNDAYNANPTSVTAALRTVRDIASDRERWAVLGVMAELGDAAEAEHRRIGRLAAALGFAVVAVGEDATAIARGAGADARWVASASDAARVVDAEAASDAAVLVKGSRVAGLERCAEILVSASAEVAG